MEENSESAESVESLTKKQPSSKDWPRASVIFI